MGIVNNMAISAADMVDLDRYPIADLGRTGSKAVADQCRQKYLETGLCILPDFITPEAHKILTEEANAISGQARPRRR